MQVVPQKLGGVGTLCQQWELHMARKSSLTWWRAKCGETDSLKNFYMLFFSDLIQSPKKLFVVVIIAFCLFVRFSVYLKKMPETFNTWFSNIQIKYIRKIKISLLKHSTKNNVKHNRPVCAAVLVTIFCMTTPAWNIIYFSDLLTVKYVQLCLSIKVNLCSF